jgi:hypothetical protein
VKDNKTFQQFKRRCWDNAMINYMMVECRIPIAGVFTRHTYPETLELNTKLLGEAEFRRQYPRKQPYKTDAWLYKRIVSFFSVQKVSATIPHRYPSLNLYDSGI